ncbi:MAG: hypothetical protein KAS73_14980 [Candidatus Sabulitectum sp.]|nr:hypothetical protein [Candidatus Sabulitectum sp.]
MNMFQRQEIYFSKEGELYQNSYLLLLATVFAVESAGISNTALENDMTASEDSLLSEYSAMVFRPDPESLCFVLSSGDTLCISNSISSMYAVHKLCGYLPDANYFTVDIFGFEYSLFLLINCNSGYRTFAVSPPVQSPDGNRLLCAWRSPIGNFYENGIQIFRIEGDSLVMEFSGTCYNWCTERVRWLSDTAVAYSRLPLFPSEFPSDSTLDGAPLTWMLHLTGY